MPVDPITVRLATEDDLPALGAHEQHRDPHVLQAHLDRQRAGSYYFAVAVDAANSALGVGALDCRLGELCPELRDLLVYPEARNHGVATRIARFLEGLAAEHAFTEVFLRVDPADGTAVPVFIGLDYTPTGDHLPAIGDPVGTGSAPRMDAVYRKSLRMV